MPQEKIDWIYVESGEIIEAYTLEEALARFKDLYAGSDLTPERPDVMTLDEYYDALHRGAR